MKHFLYFIFFIFFISTNAQERFVFSLIDNKGLSDNRIRCLNQLEDGRMIIVSAGIVNIYDGINFQPLHYIEGEAYYLKDYTGFHHTYIDVENRLWIKNTHSLLMFDISKESFIPALDEIFKNQGIIDSITDIFMDSSHNMWYVTRKKDLYLKKNEEDFSQVFANNIYDPNSERDVIYDIASLDNELYIFYRSGLLVCFDLTTKKELYVEYPFTSQQKNLYTYTLMVVPYNQYIYQVRNGLKEGIVMRFNVKNKQWNTILKTPYRLNTLSVDKNGNCMVSTQTGFWHIDEYLNNKRFVSQLELVDGKVFKTEISTQYHDKNGGLWIGTVNRSLLYYHPDRFKFRNYGKTYFNNYGSKELRVSCFEVMENELLTGTENGLFKLDKNSGNLIKYAGLPSDMKCSSMHKSRNNKLWLCAGEKGIYELNANNIKNHVLNKSANCFYEWNENNSFVGTDNGLFIFNMDNGKLKAIESPQNKQLGQVYQIVKMNSDELIGISQSGIFIFNPIEEKLILLDKMGTQDKMVCNHNNKQYNCIFKDSRGLIWFGTNDGLYIWSPEQNTNHALNMENGLVNNVIQSIIEDNIGKIWISTAKGISNIEISKQDTIFQFASTNYNQYDGVIENEFVSRAVFIYQNSKIYWGGLDGFNELDQSRLTSTRKPLKPLITKFSVFGNEIKQGIEYDGNLVLNESVTTAKKINLKHNQNYFEFELSALNYINPTRTFYKYKLEGIDDEWREINGDKEQGRIYYTNISPGTYNFMVFASSEKGVWDGEYSSISVIINPPIWKTGLAYILYALILISIAYWTITIYLRRNRLRNQQKQKEELDQMKFSFFTNVSHELRTPITLIMTPLDSIIAKMEEGDLKNKLKSIYRNANTLLSMINQLLDFRKLELKGEKLNLSFCDIGEFFEAICLDFSDFSDSKKIKFTTEIETKNEYAYIDKMKLQKVANNLLLNASKYTDQNGNIHFLVKKTKRGNNSDHDFYIQVKDSGCGISEEEIPKIFDRFYQSQNSIKQNTGSGIGLHLAKEYVDLHGGNITVESKVGEGSTFTVSIPADLYPEMEKGNDNLEKERDKHQSHILLVEDNPEFREFLKHELSGNYKVQTAKNGKEGLKMALEHVPNLIISDLMMPEMSGSDMCKSLKNDVSTSHIPFILLSARSADTSQLEGFEAGADAYITKPFNMEILLTRVKHLLTAQQKRKALFENAIIVNPDMVATNNIDKNFMTKVFNLINSNLSNTSYSVETLSKDMCMDRTGLYRKLVALSGNSPTDFIRKIRLKKGAAFIKQGLSITEVSEAVGFKTVSYFSKCFQDEFGQKPTSYGKV